MRITMTKAEALLDALEALESAGTNVSGPLEEWRDLDGETDQDSREARADAREQVEDGLDDLRTAVADAAEALGMKVVG